MKILKLCFVISTMALFIFACTETKPTNTTANNTKPNATVNTQPSATVDEIASGRKLFSDNCVICHKEDGTGGKVVIEGKKLNPEDLTSAKIKGFSDEKMIGYITNGIADEGMPAFKDKLSEAQIKDVVKFIRKDLQGK